MDNQQYGQTGFSTVCEKCGRTLYEGEMLNINGKYVCEPCAERCVFGDFGASPRRKRSSVSPFFNFIFSFHPGAGQMYQGFMKRGLFQMCLFYACIFLCATVMPSFFGMLIPIICIYSFFDSLSLRRRVSDGEDIPDELGGIADFLGRNKGIVTLVIVIMIACGVVSSLLGIVRYNSYTSSAVREIGHGVEVYIDEAVAEAVAETAAETVEDAQDRASHSYTRTEAYSHVPVTRAFLFGTSPLLLILIGGLIVVKSGRSRRHHRRGEHVGHEPENSVHDVYDSNDR